MSSDWYISPGMHLFVQNDYECPRVLSILASDAEVAGRRSGSPRRRGSLARPGGDHGRINVGAPQSWAARRASSAALICSGGSRALRRQPFQAWRRDGEIERCSPREARRRGEPPSCRTRHGCYQSVCRGPGLMGPPSCSARTTRSRRSKDGTPRPLRPHALPSHRDARRSARTCSRGAPRPRAPWPLSRPPPRASNPSPGVSEAVLRELPPRERRRSSSARRSLALTHCSSARRSASCDQSRSRSATCTIDGYAEAERVADPEIPPVAVVGSRSGEAAVGVAQAPARHVPELDAGGGGAHTDMRVPFKRLSGLLLHRRLVSPRAGHPVVRLGPKGLQCPITPARSQPTPTSVSCSAYRRGLSRISLMVRWVSSMAAPRGRRLTGSSPSCRASR